MITVRRAEGSDIPWLLTQLRAFDQFFKAKLSLFPDDDTAVEKLAAFMNPEVGCFFVAIGNDGPLGFIAGFLTPHLFNPKIRLLSEIFWWVSPEWRGTSAGARLLAAYEEYGKRNADWVAMTLEVNSPVKPAALERRGFRLYESSYLKEICEPNVSITAEPVGSEDAAWIAGNKPALLTHRIR